MTLQTRKIIAIGGGEIGRPGTQIETESIDKEIIQLSGKSNPKLLFLPTATEHTKNYNGYIEVIEAYFGKKLGCKVDYLLLKGKPSSADIREKIFASDIIYVGGGNTLRMMNLWRRLRVDSVLQQAQEKGKVLCGVSAGSICWFSYGQSDSWKMANPKNPYIRVTGLGLIPALHAPHFTREPARHKDLKSITKRTTEVGIALEDCCALEVVGNEYRILISKPQAKAYKCYWKAGKYHQDVIPQLKEFSPLESLLEK